MFYPTGHVQVTGRNRAGEKTGVWIGYYPSGKLSGKASYEKDKQVSASFFNENGKPNKNMTIFMRDSDYPGGPAQWLRFLNKTMRYPDSAVTYEIEGTVVVQFKITTEGKAAGLEIIQSVNKWLDAEALRVMRLMKDWEPAIIGGILTESWHKQPIVFNLQNQ